MKSEKVGGSMSPKKTTKICTWLGTSPMVSPASCLACHQLGSPPFTTWAGGEDWGEEGPYLEDVPVLERQPYLWAGKQCVLGGVVAEECSDEGLGGMVIIRSLLITSVTDTIFPSIWEDLHSLRSPKTLIFIIQRFRKSAYKCINVYGVFWDISSEQ